MKRLSKRKIKEGKHGDSAEHRVRVKLPKGVSFDEAITLICNEYERRCNHSHDCCGCWSHRPWEHTIKRARRREWVFVLHSSCNV
jgi:hypothetical protein